MRELYNLTIALEITNRCLNNCAHCYLASSEVGSDLCYKKIQRIIKSLETINGLFGDRIKMEIGSLTGGDPFLYEDGGYDLADVTSLIINSYGAVDVHVGGWLSSPKCLYGLLNKRINYYMTFTSYVKDYKNLFLKTFSDIERLSENISVDVLSEKRCVESVKSDLIAILTELGYCQEGSDDNLYMRRGVKNVRVMCKEIWPCGRGKYIVDAIPADYECIYKRKKNYYVYMDIFGNVYPCARAGAKSLLPVANIFENSPQDFVDKFCKFISDKSGFITNNGPKCSTCQSLL